MGSLVLLALLVDSDDNVYTYLGSHGLKVTGNQKA